MDRFSKFNPKVCFLFFLLQIILSLVIFHPFYLLIDLAAAFLYSFKLRGKKAIGSFCTFILPLIIFIALFNMIFAHYGVTVLFTVFSVEFTLEALFYGLNQGMMFSAVILWLSCYSVVMTSDKFLSVFSRFAPNSSLVFSMVLSFLPRLRKNAEEIIDAGKTINSGQSKLKKSIENFSVLITLTLEESIEVSDSMKARGFKKGRKPYSKYVFNFCDLSVMIFTVTLFAVSLYYRISGRTEFVFDPVISMGVISAPSVTAYAVMSFLPLVIDVWEDIKWLYLKRKI